MIRLFEAFSGYGSQSLTLKKYGVEYKLQEYQTTNNIKWQGTL